MGGADKMGRETFLVLQQLRESTLLAPANTYARYEVGRPKDTNYPSVQNQISILAHLLVQGAIKIHRGDYSVAHAAEAVVLEDLLPRHSNEHGAKGIRFEAVLPKFDEMLEEYSRYAAHTASVAPNTRLWITKDENGDCWFDGNKVYFKNIEADYVRIFIAVLSIIPNGGEVTYAVIKKQCKGADKRAVQRALTGEYANFFKYVPSVKRMLAYRIPLFEALHNGKGIRFNNKR